MPKNFEKRLSVTDDGQSSARGTEHPLWRRIREWSVVEFVNRTSRLLGAPTDRRLRAELYDMALSDGRSEVTFKGIRYTGEMILDVWKAGVEADPTAPMSRAEWLDFCEAMRALRDPNTRILGDRSALLRIGETIDARQRPHAERQGWA